MGIHGGGNSGGKMGKGASRNNSVEERKEEGLNDVINPFNATMRDKSPQGKLIKANKTLRALIPRVEKTLDDLMIQPPSAVHL